MINPVTTYRIQFNNGFTFRHFRDIIPYLKQLGITTIYASPIFQAVPGSIHGYDITDPNVINPEIGTEEELMEISKELKQNGMLWLQDIVPNHMAYHSDNEWLMDVLEKGVNSKYRAFFDTAYADDEAGGKLMVPFLGKQLEQVIIDGALSLVYSRGLKLKYYDAVYPVAARTYKRIIDELPQNEAWRELAQQLESLKQVEDALQFSGRFDELKLQFVSLLKNSEAAQQVQLVLDAINSNSQLLTNVAEEQSYRLCHWQETDTTINYRRFFTINSLISVNIQYEDVLHQHHALIKRLCDAKVIDGLRVDHIDGLYDPEKYLADLRKLVGQDTYIVVEKILGAEETLPANWNVQGSSGYEFLATVNNLLFNRDGYDALKNYYQSLSHTDRELEQQIREKKRMILQQHMRGDLDNLYLLFSNSNLVTAEQITKAGAQNIKTAIGELLVYCPVYRFYGNSFPLRQEEETALKKMFAQIAAEQPVLKSAIAIVADVLLRRSDDEDYNERRRGFYMRCLQFSGPLMAKGVEDTLMYCHNAFIASNEVGDHMLSRGLTMNEFHRSMQQRRKDTPLALNATATHDTKRGEDARARLHVLTDVSNEWISTVGEWQQIASTIKNNNIPSAEEEYMLYQAMVAHLPMSGVIDESFVTRLLDYIEKALREAKVHSNWNNPDLQYEATVKQFAADLLQHKPFAKSFTKFIDKVSDHGIINSLVQTVLKFTCPGVPDMYQGAELWDLSFVDPDNRRAVDYSLRMQMLHQEKNALPELKDWWPERKNGAVKLHLLKFLCELRKSHPDLWSRGQYEPVAVTGKYKENIIGYERKYRQDRYVVLLPLHTASLAADYTKIDWSDTVIELEDCTATSVVSGKNYGNRLHASDLFTDLPLDILRLKTVQSANRGAGILLSISSLPSRFGIGDIGPEALRFVDFLEANRQKYWQMLPINPTEEGQGYSPYSSTSGKAGNPLLISPEWLVDDQLLDASEITYLKNSATVDYEGAEQLKFRLLDKAYERFSTVDHPLKQTFIEFCEKEKDWLDDYAAYALFKTLQNNKPWYEWPDALKFGRADAALLSKHAGELQKIKWIQFIFFQQWQKLKSYCNEKEIQIIGDLPIYVSYDSADVWSNREIFALNEQGAITGVAGVPPDAFSDDGQLWGMPVYNWSKLKEQNYEWWIQRIKRNLELYDLIRIDHFRAMESYWEVAARETTAKNGEWKPGPGADLFKTLQKHFGELPFLAEDLGDVDEAVFALRDQFKLPGMKVLQFAFGDDLPTSTHIPHNYPQNAVVFTGTHDNNTTLGWFRTEADDETKANLQLYFNKAVDEANVTQTMICCAYASAADTVIIPMQDILNLDESARLNKPSSATGNWHWRLLPQQIERTAIDLQQLVWLYGRA